MLESLINPKRAEKGPWKMFFIGLIYASLSLLLVHFLFSNDVILSKVSGILIVLFCVMFSLPFMYYVIKNEEKEDEETHTLKEVWKVHGDAILEFMFLFLGFIVAFSFWNIILKNPNLLSIQVQTYCSINNPGDIESCVAEYSFSNNIISGNALSNETRLMSIIGNNFGVMILTLIFSLIFGAGAIFILAWNASVISAAIGIFANYNIQEIPRSIFRYMIHGFPEIAAYFIVALAGGMLGVEVIKRGVVSPKFTKVLTNVIFLVLIAIAILVAAAFIEVYLTPILFS
jgi:uncharacterized membrane protein SpoIIM required for sporulation